MCMKYQHLFYLFLGVLCFGHSAQAASVATSAKQAIVKDFDTGQILFEKNADEQMYPSSMSKVMTIYAVFEALKKNEISLDDSFRVSEKAWKKGGSKMFVEVGKQVTIEDLIRGVAIQSGNDATIVLAEGLMGNEDYFAEHLNLLAQELGMKNSHFMNASGWPDPEHYSTAEDLSKLAEHIIRDFPEFYHYFSEKEFTYNNIHQRNRNPVIYRNIGADGLKTGHTEAGGYGVIASGIHKGRRVIVVVNGLESEKTRARESADLLEWGMFSFENKKLFSAGDTVASARVVFGKDTEVKAQVKDDVLVTLSKKLEHQEKLEAKAIIQEPLIAPLKAGQEIGKLVVNNPNLGQQTFPLYAESAIEEKGFISKGVEKIPYVLHLKK